jgi:hypothetical protein
MISSAYFIQLLLALVIVMVHMPGLDLLPRFFKAPFGGVSEHLRALSIRAIRTRNSDSNVATSL